MLRDKFQENRLEIKPINIGYNLDLFIVNPLIQKEDNIVCLFINGLNGDSVMVNYFNYPVFDNKYLITYNNRQHGNNNYKATRNYKVIMNDIKLIIQNIKTLYPNKKIYLIGESWGATLSIHSYYKNINNIDGIFIWNMPRKIINLNQENKTNEYEKKSVLISKLFASFLLNINTYSYTIFPEILTNNPTLKRLISLKAKKETNNKNSIVVWLSLKPAWKKFFKILKDINGYNIFYVQSDEDALQDKKVLIKLKNRFPELIDKNLFFIKGTHLLSFDNTEAINLFEIMNKKIK